jgi:hypothetical protein
MLTKQKKRRRNNESNMSILQETSHTPKAPGIDRYMLTNGFPETRKRRKTLAIFGAMLL